MTENSSSPVVVAVGRDPMDAALAFAVDEATVAGCPLVLAHVVHLPPKGAETAVLIEKDVERVGRHALDSALATARDLLPPGAQVTTDLRLGPIVPTLAEIASGARMVVLQRRDLTAVRRVVTRSVSSGVAARARVPVVSVPEQWSPVRLPASSPTVTVGVDLPEPGGEVLRAAASAARWRGAVLHVLHAWGFPAVYEDIGISGDEIERWTTRATSEIRSGLDALGPALQGVPTRIDVSHGLVADALVAASAKSDLLVVGRHDTRMPLGSHLGPIARAVLREAHCPVLLVDPRRAPGQERRGDADADSAGQRV